MQNSAMSYYEELLTLGSHLREDERIALYKFLLRSKREVYITDARELLISRSLRREIANGDILYTLTDQVLSYSAKMKNESAFIENLRSLQLSKIPKLKVNKIVKFFAQSEVDVIWNYPIQGENSEEEGSFSIISIPYFDLRYYSERRSRVFGFINKLRSTDSKILDLLKTP